MGQDKLTRELGKSRRAPSSFARKYIYARCMYSCAKNTQDANVPVAPERESELAIVPER